MKTMLVCASALLISSLASAKQSTGSIRSDESQDYTDQFGLVFTPPLAKLNYQGAQSFCQNLTRSGSSDWRMPTFADVGPSAATEIRYSFFWLNGWFGSGDVTSYRAIGKFGHYIQTWQETDAADVVCVQTNLGLIWKDVTTDAQGTPSNCLKSSANCTYKYGKNLLVSHSIGHSDWYTAQSNTPDGCAGLTTNGIANWRLPESSELSNIVHSEFYRLSGVNLTASSVLWSSESKHGSQNYAAVFHMDESDGVGRSRAKNDFDVEYVCVKSVRP